MRGRLVRTHRGFSLIEALVALLLVLLGLTGAAQLQASLLAASAEAKARDEATALALAQLAGFQSQLSYAGYADDLVSGSDERTGMLHSYQLHWDIEHTPAPDYKLIAVQVNWPVTNPLHTLEIQTLAAGLDTPRFARQQLQH